MTEVWLRAALWLGLALAATLISIRLRVATALSEIVVGTVAQLLIGAFVGTALLGTTESWITFLSATGAVFLTFLAGAELDPAVLRTKWRETGVMGLVSFAAPFLGCAAYARYVLGWSSEASWLTGVALSTTSVAVVYAVMLELGLNSTGFGKAVLAACFVCDLGTVVALGLIFAPFTYRTLVFAIATAIVIGVLPWVTPRFFRAFGGRPSELEAKYLLLVLFALGGLAAWADSEAVLPAYLVGMVLAGTVGKDHALIRRLRTLTFGFLTPFYFIRAGSFVSVPALVAAPGIVAGLFFAKLVDEIGRVARHAVLSVSAYGGGLCHAADVHRTDVRQHLRAVRPDAPHHRPGPVLGTSLRPSSAARWSPRWLRTRSSYPDTCCQASRRHRPRRRCRRPLPSATRRDDDCHAHSGRSRWIARRRDGVRGCAGPGRAGAGPAVRRLGSQPAGAADRGRDTGGY